MSTFQSPTQRQPPAEYQQIHDTSAEKAAQYHYQQTNAPGGFPFPSRDVADSSVVRVKRVTAVGVLAALAVLLLCVIGLGAGLGVSQRNVGHMQTDLQVAQQAITAAALANGPTTIYVPTTPTQSSSPPKSTTSSTPKPKSDVQCPAINGTEHIVSANNSTANSSSSVEGKRFRLLCGLDYGEGEATDIGNVKTKNLAACADACARKTNCTGAGWGVIKGDAGPEHTCWLKTNLTRFHNATSAWGFAILLPEE